MRTKGDLGIVAMSPGMLAQPATGLYTAPNRIVASQRLSRGAWPEPASLFPYWILFGLTAIGAVQAGSRPRHDNRIGVLLALFGVGLLLMVGLRYEVGGDWATYLEIFDFQGRSSLSRALTANDPAYSVLNWIASRLGAGIWLVNTVCAAAFTWGLLRFTSQQLNPWLSLAVAIPYLVIVVAMGYTRQAVAIGFILAGLASIREKKSMLRFAGLVIIATLFHRSAIVILPLVALAFTRNRIMIAFLGATLGVILFYLLVNAGFEKVVQNYVVAEYDAQGAGVRIAMNLLPALLFLTFQRRFALDDIDMRLWRNFALAAVFASILLLLVRSSVVVDRLSLYLIPLQLVVLSRLPYVFSRDTSPNAALTMAVIGFSGVVQLVWLTAATHAEHWLPYQSFLT